MSQKFLRRGPAAAFFLTIGLTLAPALFAAEPQFLPNFQKINEHVYRGGQPASEGFKELARLGVRTVIDLRTSGEHSQAEEEQLVKASGMRYVNVPFRGMSAPTNEQISKVLAFLDDSSAWPVFVHCRRGADRTGTVVACYRIVHDHWQNQKALNEAKKYGMSWLERGMQHYVLRYQPDVSNASLPSTTAAPAVAQ
jgi:uncharacterized protein (TIGR01244 family)